MSVSARVSTGLATVLTYDEIAAVIEAILAQAQEGSIAAARELRAWISLADEDAGAQDGEMLAWEDMSPAQRAAARAQLQRELARLQAEVDEGEHAGSGEDDAATAA